MRQLWVLLALVLLTGMGKKDPNHHTNADPTPVKESRSSVAPPPKARTPENPAVIKAVEVPELAPPAKASRADLVTELLRDATLSEEKTPSQIAVPPRPQSGDEGKPVAVSLIVPYQGVVSQLAGDRYRSVALLDPGEDLHQIQLSGAAMQLLSEADVYLKMGLAQEESLILPQLPQDVTIVDLSQAADPALAAYIRLDDPDLFVLLGAKVELSQGYKRTSKPRISPQSHDDNHDHSHEELDVHYWLGADQLLQQLPLISVALSKRDPGQRPYYQQRLEGMLRRVEQVSSEITSLLEPLSGQIVAQYHPFLQYFLNNFSLKGLGIEREGREVTLAEIEQLRRVEGQIHLRTLFIQQVDSPRNPSILAQRLGWRLVPLQVFGDSWEEVVLGIAHALYAEYLFWQGGGNP